MAEGLMAGKRGLIMGVANNRSIAWGIAKALHAQGAEIAFSYQGEALKKRVEPLAAEVGSDFLVECDVTSDEAMDETFRQIKEKWGRLDFLIVDTPPGTSDEHLAALSCAPQSRRDGCLLVTQPTPVSLAQTRREAALCARMHAPVLGIVENMSGYVCACCGECSDVFGDRERSGGAAVAAELGCALLARVPLDPQLCASADAGACLQLAEPPTAATRALLDVRERVLTLLGAKDEQW